MQMRELTSAEISFVAGGLDLDDSGSGGGDAGIGGGGATNYEWRDISVSCTTTPPSCTVSGNLGQVIDGVSSAGQGVWDALPSNTSLQLGSSTSQYDAMGNYTG